MQRYTARNSFSSILGYIFLKIFCHLVAKVPKFFQNFGLQRIWVFLKVSDAHPYPQIYRSAPPPHGLLPAHVHIIWKICFKLLTLSRQMSFKLFSLQIMIGFPSGLKFIKLKKVFWELKILMRTYKGSYQPMVNIFASRYVRI